MTTPDIAGMKRLHGNGVIDDTEALQQRLNAAPDIAGLCERLRVVMLHGYSNAENTALAQAADTLERQAAEIERLREAAKTGFLFIVGLKMAMAVESNGWQWPDDAPDTVPIPAERLRAALTGED